MGESGAAVIPVPARIDPYGPPAVREQIMTTRAEYSELGVHRSFLLTHPFIPPVDGYAPGGRSER